MLRTMFRRSKGQIGSGTGNDRLGRQARQCVARRDGNESLTNLKWFGAYHGICCASGKTRTWSPRRAITARPTTTLQRAGTNRPLAGRGARRLGLEGDVKQADWEALCDNLHPETGEQLTPRTRANRTVGYDFNFHVPKTVSLLYATTRDERILDAFRDSVDGTMHDMEEEMADPRQQRRQKRKPPDGQHGLGGIHPLHVTAGGRYARSASARPLLRVSITTFDRRGASGRPASSRS